MKRRLTQKDRRLLREGRSGFARFFRTTNHFFPNLADQLNQMEDPRHPSYIIYTQSTLVMEMILMHNSGISSMRGMTRQFNSEDFIRNLGKISKAVNISEKPDWQTINNYLERLDICELEEIRYDMIRKLIRTKQFTDYTVNGSYCIIIDGTDIAYFRKPHCEHDLVKKITDKETGEVTYQYFHKALEAKILLGPGLLLSVATEFIENEDANVTKQDCEINAGIRLLDKIKKAFPRLDIVIVGDALYCTMPFMKAVTDKGWHYIFRVKEGRQGKLFEDFEDLITQIGNDERLYDICENEKGVGLFVNHVEQVTNKSEVCNMYRYISTGETTRQFDWVTDIEMTKKNLRKMIRAGKDRWKIENNGFNTQKNGIYHLEHHCSLDWNAMKNHYVIIQISHILMQLYMEYDHVVNMLKEGMKHTAADLLSSLISRTITEIELEYVNQRTALHMCCLLAD